MMKQIISNKKTMLGIILGIATIAAIGTTEVVYAYTTPSNATVTTSMPGKFAVNIPAIQGSININQLLMQSVKTKFVDAANTAQSAVTSGTVIGGELGPNQGYYVYNFRVLDSAGKTHLVIVDAGNGQVLSNTEMPDGFSAVGGNVVMFHGIGGSMADMPYQALPSTDGPIVIPAPNK